MRAPSGPPSRIDRRRLVLGATALGLAGARPAEGAAAGDLRLRRIIAAGPRSPADRARDIFRHPEASLLFWGLKPGQTVIEIEPGSGWWTDILAPYLAQTGGHYIGAEWDLTDPGLRPAARAFARKEIAAFEAKYATNSRLYGDVSVASFGPLSRPLAPAGSVDLVLVSRSIHNWVLQDGYLQKALKDFRTALKPGGVLAVEEHRAADGSDPKKGDGYLSETFVIGEAAKAGFVLAARSEINANPKDTKAYPFGVWTLPPTRRSAPPGQPDNPKFDHAPYDAIGESDRMTIKFIRPS